MTGGEVGLVLAVLVAGCSGEPEPKDSLADSASGTGSVTDPGSTTETDGPPTTEPAPGVREASCERAANPLRVSCSATLDGPGTAVLELSAPGAPTRTFAIEGEAGRPIAVAGWGLLPETVYTWRAGDRSGEVVTGSLPPELAAAEIETTGRAWGFDAVLRPMRCGSADYFALVDGDGEIIWYEPSDVFFAESMTGYEWSQSSRSVLSCNSRSFLEQDVSGQVVLSLDRGEDYEHPLHHDVARWGQYRYLLFERPVGGLNVDGIYVFDGGALIGTFFLDDHFEVTGGGGGDWAHANGLNVTEDGLLVMSLLNFDTVVAIDGDPASPGFLQVVWHAAGTDRGLPDADYRPIAGPGEGFDGQHNASLHDGALWLFDNRSQGDSRAIRLRMDEAGGTLALDAAWSFDTTCTNQGGSLPLDGGGALATCANANLVWAFEEGATEPSWTLHADCGGGGDALPLTRAIPVFVR